MNVALLNPWFWPEVRRGSERLVHDLAVDLLRLGHRPRLLTSHRGRATTTIEDGFPVVRSRRLPEGLLALRNFQPGLTHLPLTYLELRRGDDDVAHAFYPTDAVAAVRWGRETGSPVVFSYMGIPRRDALANLRLRLRAHEIALEADAVTVLSRAARDAMWRWLGVEAEVVPPGVDLELFAAGGERTAEPTIACAADPADPRKRIPLMVEAFGIVRRSRPDARLLLMAPSDPALAARLAAHEGVELLDVDSRGVAEVFRSAWATGLTSFGEAFGLVLVESMACGTPVFARNDGAAGEIIDRPEVGRLFDGDEPGAVARAMLEAVGLAEDNGTVAACRQSAERFDTMSGARAYVEIYGRLLSSPR